jgi:hypothetical protein
MTALAIDHELLVAIPQRGFDDPRITAALLSTTTSRKDKYLAEDRKPGADCFG